VARGRFPRASTATPTSPSLGKGILRGGCIALADTRDDYGRSNAEHIASWHPVVALAVADWLDGVAQAIENWERGYGPSPDQSHAYAVARSYIGAH
jgi:hypothetical protein